MMHSSPSDSSDDVSPCHSKFSIFQDWQANKGNVKGQIILTFFRLANSLSYIPKPFRYFGYPYLIMYRIIVEWILCVELPWKLKIGRRLKLHHGQALVVNDHVIIGKDCILRHSTTIGVAVTSNNYSGSVPVIGDYVDIGSNVVILGGIHIGDRAVIGAGSVIVNDIPKGAVVVGNPARIIKIIT